MIRLLNDNVDDEYDDDDDDNDCVCDYDDDDGGGGGVIVNKHSDQYKIRLLPIKMKGAAVKQKVE